MESVMNAKRATWPRRAAMLGALAGFAVLLSGCHLHGRHGGHRYRDRDRDRRYYRDRDYRRHRDRDYRDRW
jgi:hypothetical protein